MQRAKKKVTQWLFGNLLSWQSLGMPRIHKVMKLHAWEIGIDDGAVHPFLLLLFLPLEWVLGLCFVQHCVLDPPIWMLCELQLVQDAAEKKVTRRPFGNLLPWQSLGMPQTHKVMGLDAWEIGIDDGAEHPFLPLLFLPLEWVLGLLFAQRCVWDPPVGMLCELQLEMRSQVSEQLHSPSLH